MYMYVHTYMFVGVNFDALAQASDFRIERRQVVSFAECRIRSWAVWDTESPADWIPTHKPIELSRIRRKTWTQQPVPIMSEHSAHLTLMPIGFHNWHGSGMMMSSNGNIFRVTGPLCGEFTGPGEFPAQRPVTRNFDVFLWSTNWLQIGRILE